LSFDTAYSAPLLNGIIAVEITLSAVLLLVLYVEK
jgi:hypothetical protein